MTNIKCCYQHSNNQWTTRKMTMQRMVTHQDLGESSHKKEEESNERRVVETPPDLAETIRSMMEELQSCKGDNERMIKE
jgi:hypothetical protein